MFIKVPDGTAWPLMQQAHRCSTSLLSAPARRSVLLWPGVDSIRFTTAPSASHAAKTGSSSSPQPTPGPSEPYAPTTAARTISAKPATHALVHAAVRSCAAASHGAGRTPPPAKAQPAAAKPSLPARPPRRSRRAPRCIAETRTPRWCTGWWCTPAGCRQGRNQPRQHLSPPTASRVPRPSRGPCAPSSTTGTPDHKRSGYLRARARPTGIQSSTSDSSAPADAHLGLPPVDVLV
jgi:hypothetical protein